MAIDKPSLENFLPNGFETQNKEGWKENFDSNKIAIGFDKDILEVLSGPNLNNLLDKTGKNFNTLQQFLDFFKNMPIGSFPIVNTSNQLDYKSVNSFFRNVGELVFSAIPLEDGNLRLLDGSLLEYTMTYSRFITYIAGLKSSLPNLFCTEQEFNQSVATYGVCGKFVYDAVTKSLRLPKISGFIKGTLDCGSLGDVDEAKAPQHSHTATAASNGAHKHDRGTMNITGQIGGQVIDSTESKNNTTTGAFYRVTTNNIYGVETNSLNVKKNVAFDASRAWTGQTSQNGGHTHNVTVGDANNSVFKAGSVNEPQAIKEFIYIVVSIDEAEKQVLSAVYNYKGSVVTYAELPTDAAIGEVYNVIGEDPEGYSGANFAWTGEEWDRLGGTVNLSGYLTKVEGANTYATNASLESNVEVLQQQINTNASNIANIASEEVIQEGIKKIEMLKFASTLGIGKVTDTDLFAVINKYKRSSFDRSKFTVVGSLNITDDGIASGFSLNDYLLTPTIDFRNANSFEIISPVFSVSEFTGTQELMGTLVVASTLRQGGFWFVVLNTGKIYMQITFTDWSDQIPSSLGTLELNKKYQAKIKYTGSAYEFYYREENGEWISLGNTPSDLKLSSFNHPIGIGKDGLQNSNSPYCTVDLKTPSIIIDGVEVFSGNKTGIDTIKPSNFTAITSSASSPFVNPSLPFSDSGLTISADGVASGFSSSNYLSTSTIDFPNAQSWEVVSQFNYVSHTATLGVYQFLNGGYSNDLYINTSGYIKINISVGASNTLAFSSQVASSSHSAVALTSGSDVKVELKFTGTQYIFNVYQNGSLIYADTKNSTASIYPATSNSINIGLTSYDGNLTTGSIDLNAFKIYVDGNLVYQPCLKIPFHLSKTGLKVTDKLDRAIDMAEQCSFSQYFGLDEQNGLCLVPQGENITGRRDLVSRVEDSTTHYVTEIYSDLYCKQMGSGTASTAVTLNIPYKDANYKLSVPQNAKSKTGFTPTASCDWTAEGYIYLDEVI